MDTLTDVLSDIRIFLYGGMVNLPLTIAGSMLLLGLFTANYAMLFFLLGYLILSPLFTLGVNFIYNLVSSEKVGYMSTTDVCKVNTHSTNQPSDSKNPFASPWMGMISFFLGYMVTNSVVLFSRDSMESTITVKSTSAPDINTKVSHRRSQAMISLLSILVFAVVTLWFRHSTGCENVWGMLLTAALGGLLGFGWYMALSRTGEDRLSDLFGIANRLLPPSAITNQPIACIPVAV